MSTDSTITRGGSSPEGEKQSRPKSQSEGSGPEEITPGVSSTLDDLDSRLQRIESLLSYDGDEYHDKFHHLQSLILDVRGVIDALLDAGPEHSREEKIELAHQQRNELLDASSELEQLSTAVDELQGRFKSSSKLGKVERVLEFANGKRGKADLVAIPSEDIYGLLNDTSSRRCRQLMDELGSTLSFCQTDHKRRSDGKQQKRLKIDFSRLSYDEMLEQAGRVL